MIVLNGVTKNFGDRNVLENVTLRIEPGEFVCIVGPSGAGKSTLLALLTGAESATRGSISVDGVDLCAVPPGALQMFRRNVGIIFQDYKLLSNRTVEENIAFPLEVCGATDPEIHRRTSELLVSMKLLDRADALPRELSGGEQARTAIARAIAGKPLILIADEPTQNLDPDQARDVLRIFREINAAGATVVLATHDATLVDSLHTRVVQLEKGRIARDIVGGYHPAVTDIPTQTLSQEEIDTQAKRKVKVTAIRSE